MNSIPSKSIPAGDFSTWLGATKLALKNRAATDVTCGTCNGCCKSSYFIQIEPDEATALAAIPSDLLFPMPGGAKGHMLMGYNEQGTCPMLVDEQCSIYEQRPRTCRQYDCRVFAACEIDAGGDEKAEVNQRVKQWSFSYADETAKATQAALTSTAKFLHTHPQCFSDGNVPVATQVALLAIKLHRTFLRTEGSESERVEGMRLAIHCLE